MAIIDDLVSYYKCDENAANTTVADAHGSNTGTASTNTSNLYVASGQINSAFSMDGSSDEFTTNYAPNFNPSTDEFTISCWAKATNKGSLHGVWGTNVGSNQRMYLAADDGTPNKWVVVLNGSPGTKIFSIDTIDYGEWVHLMVDFDGAGGVELFVNSVSQGTETAPSFSTTGDLVIGDVGTAGVNFNGVIDEVAVFDASLGQAGATELYNSGAGLAYPFSADGTNMQINIGDVWKEVPAVQINIGDVWKEVVSIKQNIGDVWKEVF